MGGIIRHDYPELDKVLWDFHPQRVPADFAFRMYEERWRFIDADNISSNECSLIEELTNLYGNGVFIAS
ncbi:hypothetical protein MJO48_07145 [Dickeya fangzhongdai]|uniref:hypothetical protein n=1 Tax=Dickeya fangzhongdai TaxID=1778540 RepID=UPI001EFB2587|nr:hypothetical protein [Dickeya fangzhongdai]ULR32451.1 hypothetical protein MJO48_07145 [Dickeya fangzhongdai]